MRRVFAFLFALAFLGVTASALADVPTAMSVQGRLTNGAGAPVPAGLKNFTFKIFDQQVGGVQIWPGGPGETQALPTDANGLWNAGVGTVIPLTEAVFLSPVRWLEVTVNDGVNPIETLPRIELRTNPYTYRAATSQHADSLGGLTLFDLAERFVDTSGDVMTGPLRNRWPLVDIGANIDVENINDGHIQFWNDVDGTWGVQAEAQGDNHLWNIGVAAAAIGDNNVFGPNQGVFTYAGGTGSGNIGIESATLMNGTYNYSGYFRDGDFAVLNPFTPGTAGVSLPANAIDDGEILDEPGITQNVNNVAVAFNSVSMTDIVTTTITTPDDGYIVVEATTNAEVAGISGADNWSYIQIDEIAGGTATVGPTAGCAVMPNASSFYYSVAARETYFKLAGTYTFRLEGMDLAPASMNWAYNATITATYFPRSYGSVTTVARQDEANQFSSAKAVPRASQPPQVGAMAAADAEVYYVDLRELELKVARAEADAERARRELVEAQLNSPKGPVATKRSPGEEPKQ